MFLNVSGRHDCAGSFWLSTRLIMLQYHKFNVGVSKIKTTKGFLLEAEKCLYIGSINARYQTAVGKIAFLLFGLLGQDVALEGVFSFDLS